MNININLNTLMAKLTPVIIVILIAMMLNSILYLYLPKVHFCEIEQAEKIIEYKKYRFKENFQALKIVKHKRKIPKSKKEYKLISNILLKMIYKEKENTGWIVISDKSSLNSKILGIGEVFKNYRLIKIFEGFVVFSKNNKEYKVLLDANEKNFSYIQTNHTKDRIKKSGGQYYFGKNLIKEYMQDSSKMWKEISISEIKNKGKSNGFKINKIAKKSLFIDLGLKEGDIIKSVNNIKLKSYADAFDFYGKINKVRNMKLTVLRGNKIVELEYEIK